MRVYLCSTIYDLDFTPVTSPNCFKETAKKQVYFLNICYLIAFLAYFTIPYFHTKYWYHVTQKPRWHLFHFAPLRLQAHMPEFKNYTFTKVNFSGTATHTNDCFGFLEPQGILINKFGKTSMHFSARFFYICNNVSKSPHFNDFWSG